MSLLAASGCRSDSAADQPGNFLIRPAAEQLVILGCPVVAQRIYGWNFRRMRRACTATRERLNLRASFLSGTVPSSASSFAVQDRTGSAPNAGTFNSWRRPEILLIDRFRRA